jgi:hypothetical protein
MRKCKIMDNRVYTQFCKIFENNTSTLINCFENDMYKVCMLYQIIPFRFTKGCSPKHSDAQIMQNLINYVKSDGHILSVQN